MDRINLTQLYVAAISLVCVASLVYVLIAPPESIRSTRNGVPFFTPPVEHPETGEALDVGVLIRHFKGE